MSRKLGSKNKTKRVKGECPQGHDLLNPNNVKIRVLRECLVCDRARVVAYRAKQKKKPAPELLFANNIIATVRAGT